MVRVAELRSHVFTTLDTNQGRVGAIASHPTYKRIKNDVDGTGSIYVGKPGMRIL